jgi:uncharacterized damage-inducible protein DinB
MTKERHRNQAPRDECKLIGMTTLKDTVRIDLQYSIWATRRLLEASASLSVDEQRRDLAVSHGSVLHTLYHMYDAERFWTECLLSERIPPLYEWVRDPAPAGLQFDDLMQSWPAIWAKLNRWLETAIDETLNQTLLFKISSEAQFDVPRWQILRHVVNHATLHRGQVVGMFRTLGKQPPSVDYMEYLLQ